MTRLLITLAGMLAAITVKAQDSDTTISLYHAEAGVAAVGTTNHSVPFWMRSNLYGNVPIDGASIAVSARASKEYADVDEILMDWGGVVEARVNAGNRLQFILPQAYLKARLGIFQIMAGRAYDREGLMDSLLSCGSFSLSGNALGIPKVELSIPGYWNVPYTDHLIAVKGNFSYGWMGDLPIQYGANRGKSITSYYHHMSFYGRLGKKDWKLKFFGAINHDVIWGNDKEIFGDQYNLSDAEAFFYVVTGKKYLGAKDISKIGNHLGSLDIAAEYTFKSMKLNVYHQFFYDKGALGYLANLKDGLTGISLTNTKPRSKISWQKVLVELFYSKDQAGEPGAKETPSGPEYYYNHAVYTEGFSYQGAGLGNPLITPEHEARPNLVSDPYNYFVNNRVIAVNFGITGNLNRWNILLKGTFSRNYGDYRTSGPNEQWFNGEKVEQAFAYGKFSPVNQFSAYLEASRPLKKGYNIGFVLAGDYGDLLYNSLGGMIKLSKVW